MTREAFHIENSSNEVVTIRETVYYPETNQVKLVLAGTGYYAEPLTLRAGAVGLDGTPAAEEAEVWAAFEKKPGDNCLQAVSVSYLRKGRPIRYLRDWAGVTVAVGVINSNPEAISGVTVQLAMPDGTVIASKKADFAPLAWKQVVFDMKDCKFPVAQLQILLGSVEV